MIPLNEMVQKLIALREEDKAQITLFAACPNSVAVLEASVMAAARNNTPMLFAATLNQVDYEGGYTGWTPAQFVGHMERFAQKYGWDGPLYPCLDHGGPWLKDTHTLEGLSLTETMDKVRHSLTACLKAGYKLLHIDPTVDRTLPPDQPIPIELVIERTLELMIYAEAERERLGLPPVAYEVGTEEVHGGLVNLANFERFIIGLHEGLAQKNLLSAWPCFIVGKVGTDLHTAYFDPKTAQQLFEIVAPYGSLIKGHYTDWVENPEDYPQSGMGGANVGPEFTGAEYLALADLVAKEEALCRNRALEPSHFLQRLEQAVYESGRWKKWLQPEEKGQAFADLNKERRNWLVQTGARYIWTDDRVEAARQSLYQNMALVTPDPHQYVVDRIARAIDKYIVAFNLFDALTLLEN